MTKHLLSETMYQAFSSLTLFRGLKTDPVIDCYIGILKTVLSSDQLDEKLSDEYHRLASLLLEEISISNLPKIGDLWQNYILNLILLNNNSFTREAASQKNPSQPLREACTHDLSRLQLICHQGLKLLDSVFYENKTCFRLLGLEAGCGDCEDSDLSAIKHLLLSSENWPNVIEELISFYRKAGFGDFALYRSFRWVESRSGYGLEGIEKTDPISLNHLFGYTRQREQVLDNTERLLSGLPAQNLLLYGDRGTGKSSTVKALVNRYSGQGLRLVQMTRDSIGSLQKAMGYLGSIPLKFIIFIDDLSFEENETHYKVLKTQMEGSLELQPANVRIYVTSNQRNLIKEYFADRNLSVRDGDVHPGDTMQEKLSLADRFGLKITFLAPDKTSFLDIVRELARLENLQLDPETLEKKALKWTLWHNERSGRTARQFIDYLKGCKNLNLI